VKRTTKAYLTVTHDNTRPPDYEVE